MDQLLNQQPFRLRGRGGVLEDTIWSPWPWKSNPWPRSLQVLQNGLSSAWGQHYFFDLLKMTQGHDQFCFVLKNGRERAKKILKPFLFLENAWIFRRIYEISERRPFIFFLFIFFRRTSEFSEKFTNFWSENLLFYFIFLEINSAFLGLGLEHSCPWPR